LVLAFDGFQPFKDNYNYTTTPFLVAPVTAPPELRWSPGYAHIACMVLGRFEGNFSLSSAMGLLVDELNHLNLHGNTKVHDAATDEVVLIHVKRVLVRGDYPGLRSITGDNIRMAPARHACYRSHLRARTTSIYEG
jgi:hypothetical protein